MLQNCKLSCSENQKVARKVRSPYFPATFFTIALRRSSWLAACQQLLTIKLRVRDVTFGFYKRLEVNAGKKKKFLIRWNHVWKYSYLAIAVIGCILLLPIPLLWLQFLDCLAAHEFNLFSPQITSSFTPFGNIWCCKRYGWRRKESPVIPTFFLVPPISLHGVIYLFDTDSNNVH